MPLRTSHLLVAVVGTALLHPAVARGAEVQVNPVMVSLSPATRSALIAVRNVGAEVVRFELQVRAWDQGPGGEMLLSSSEDLVAFPPILVLGPGEERNARVGAVAPSGGPVEKTYRLFLQELPPPQRPDVPSQVRVLSRIGIPVFLAPTRVVERAAVQDLAVRGGKVSFRLRNEGTVHLRPASVRVTGTASEGPPVLERDLEAWYVLSGGVREYQLELPRDACARVREVDVAVALDRDVLRSRVALAADACRP